MAENFSEGERDGRETLIERFRDQLASSPREASAIQVEQFHNLKTPRNIRNINGLEISTADRLRKKEQSWHMSKLVMIWIPALGSLDFGS